MRTRSQSYCFHSGRYVFLFALFLCLFLPTTSITGEEVVTPSHVYHLTEKFRAYLDVLQLRDESAAGRMEDDKSLRHPRHVMQKVRECHILLTKILVRKGISPAPFMHSDTLREVRPADVKQGLLFLISELRKIGDFGEKDIVFTPGKLPGDVFNNLRKVCSSIKAEVVVADLYPIVNAVLVNLHQIARDRNIKIPRQKKEVTFSKSYREVYDYGVVLLNSLRELSLYADYSIPGGVIVPEPLLSKVEWDRALFELFLDTYSETAAIKYALHLRNSTEFSGDTENTSLTDIYRKVYQANSIVRQLLKQETQYQKRGILQ